MARKQTQPTQPAAATGNPGTAMPPTPNKSVSAPKAAIPKDVWKWGLKITIAIAILIGIACIASIARSGHEKRQVAVATTSTPTTVAIPLASSPLVIPAGAESERISVPKGMHVVWGGRGFRVTCVYGDGHKISYGAGEAPCPTGDMPFVYATNEAKETNIVPYAFAPE
jgi:hypothetical protein